MKSSAEDCLRSSGVAWTIVRSTAFLELWVEILRETAKKSGRPVVFGPGENPINFVSVADVAWVVDRAATDASLRGRVLEVGGPDNLTFKELARLVQDADHRTSDPRHVPRPVLRVLANTIGRVKPQLGRQVRAALVMEYADLRFESNLLRDEFPEMPRTYVSDLLNAAS
jgi:NADH dehydrogenase